MSQTVCGQLKTGTACMCLIAHGFRHNLHCCAHGETWSDHFMQTYGPALPNPLQDEIDTLRDRIVEAEKLQALSFADPQKEDDDGDSETES